MRFPDWKRPKFDKDGYTEYGWRCQHSDKLSLGKYSDIGCFSYLNAKHEIHIGKNVQIGSHCSIYTESTIDKKKGKVFIGDNALIGSHSTIMPGVTIGVGAVIGAHSFINKDIPWYTLAYGTPCKVVKYLG